MEDELRIPQRTQTNVEGRGRVPRIQLQQAAKLRHGRILLPRAQKGVCRNPMQLRRHRAEFNSLLDSLRGAGRVAAQFTHPGEVRPVARRVADSILWRGEGASNPRSGPLLLKSHKGPYPGGDGVQGWQDPAPPPSGVSPPPQIRRASQRRLRVKPPRPGTPRTKSHYQEEDPATPPRSQSEFKDAEAQPPGSRAPGRSSPRPQMSSRLFLSQFEQTPK